MKRSINLNQVRNLVAQLRSISDMLDGHTAAGQDSLSELPNIAELSAVLHHISIELANEYVQSEEEVSGLHHGSDVVRLMRSCS